MFEKKKKENEDENFFLIILNKYELRVSFPTLNGEKEQVNG